MSKPDDVKAWEKAVEVGLIKGDPSYYHGKTLVDGAWQEGPRPPQWETDHALITSLLEVNGTPWDAEPPPPPDGEGWGDGVAFGARPTQATQIRLVGQSNVVIDNLAFEEGNFIYQDGRGHNAHVCILLEGCTNITIRNCDFRNVSEPVAVIGGSNILVEYTRTDGIVGPGSRVDEQTGNFLQTVNQPSNVRIRNNKIVATTTLDPWGGRYKTMTEDVISLFSASDCLVEFNQIDATGYTRDAGTGIIAGDANGDRHMIRGNTLLNPGQVGLATAGGFGHRFYDNLVYREPGQVTGLGNTAAYFWGYQGNPIGDGRYEGNRVKWHDGGGFWNPGGAVDTGNNWNDNTLNPDDLRITL